MTVQELEDLLARLPADMPVMISGKGFSASHIGVVRKANRGTMPREKTSHECETGICVVREYEQVEYDAFVELMPPYGFGVFRSPKIIDEPPTVELRGNWPKARAKAIR